MWGDHLCPRTVGQALCIPLPTKGGVIAAGRGGVKSPPPADMNIYNGSGFLLHPVASRKPP